METYWSDEERTKRTSRALYVGGRLGLLGAALVLVDSGEAGGFGPQLACGHHPRSVPASCDAVNGGTGGRVVAIVHSPRRRRGVKMDLPPLAVLKAASPSFARLFADCAGSSSRDDEDALATTTTTTTTKSIPALHGSYAAWEELVSHVATSAGCEPQDRLAAARRLPAQTLISMLPLARAHGFAHASTDVERALAATLPDEIAAPRRVLDAAAQHRAPWLLAEAARYAALTTTPDASCVPSLLALLEQVLLHDDTTRDSQSARSQVTAPTTRKHGLQQNAPAGTQAPHRATKIRHPPGHS